MKILYVAPRLHPNYTDSLCALADQHHVIALVSCHLQNERYGDISYSHFPEGLISTILTKFYTFSGLAPVQIAYRKRHPSLIWLIRFIRENGIDTVYARRDNKHLLRTARFAASITRRRFLSYRQEIIDPEKRPDRRAVYPLRLRDDAGTPLPNYIPLAVDLARIPQDASVTPYVAGGNEPLRIMAVGKFIERKGHHLLIEAAARLRTHLPIQINIYGDYSSFHAHDYSHKIADKIAEHKLQDCVHLMPMIQNDKILEEYARHHLFVYPGWVNPVRDPDSETYARADGQCGTQLYSLLEAMAVGLPVVCSSERKVVGAVEEGGNGLVFEKYDAVDLAEKIKTISQMDLLGMGRRSRALVERSHNALSFPAHFENLIESRRQLSQGGRP